MKSLPVLCLPLVLTLVVHSIPVKHNLHTSLTLPAPLGKRPYVLPQVGFQIKYPPNYLIWEGRKYKRL